MKRDESGEIRLSQEELEHGSFDEVATMLADETMTRGRALKLAGAALLAGSGMMALFQSPADAKKKRRRRRKKRVTATPDSVEFGQQQTGEPSAPQLVQITNPTDKPVTLELVGDNSGNFSIGAFPGFDPLDVDAEPTIAPHTNATVPITFTPTTPGVDYSGQLVVLNPGGAELTAVDLTGTGVSASA